MAIRELKGPRLATYGFKVDGHDLFKEVQEWCKFHFGDEDRKNNWFSKRNFWVKYNGSLTTNYQGYGCFYFEDQINAAAFKLRWCD